MRGQLRPNAYLRLIENRWVTSESTFVEMEWWDACVDASASPVLSDRRLSVWLGVDASVKRDSTAIVAVAYDQAAQKVRLLAHRIFQPSAAEPLDFEATIERTVLEFCQRFNVVGVHFDPWQMQAVAQRLRGRGAPMTEYPQTVGNLTEASTALFELVKGRNLVTYFDADMRLAVSRAVAKETARGWRIAKGTQSHKIDVVVALAMASLGAVHGMACGEQGWLDWYRANTPGTAEARAAAQYRAAQQAEAKPELAHGDTWPRASLPETAPGDAMVRLQAPAPWQAFYASAPDGRSQRFLADSRGEIGDVPLDRKSVV